MKIFNENGDFLGEFTDSAETVYENTKETVCSWFEIGILWGILAVIASPFWGILAIVAILLFKLFTLILKFVLNSIWWTFKLPFCLLFKRELPEF